MRNKEGRFIKGTSGNAKGRPSNSGAVAQLLIPSREDLVAAAIKMALNGDVAALKLCLERISAPVKPELPCIEILDFEFSKTPLEKADRIVNAVGTGQISVDIGERLLVAISMYYKIYEMDLLEKRIEKLEIAKNN